MIQTDAEVFTRVAGDLSPVLWFDEDLQKWVRGGGREPPGLVSRRKAETALLV